ncbi:MAG: PilW family protein, partial [Burkholderiaceae bacterium]
MPSCLEQRKSGTDVLAMRRVSTTSTAATALASDGIYLQTSRCSEDLPAFAVGSTTAELTLRNTGCTQPAPAREILVRIYYISRCNDCARDTTPTLKRVEVRRGQVTVTSLVEGIEDLRIDYGFDLDNDGSSDRFARTLSGTAGAADNSWDNVMAARVHLLVRTSELPAGHTDTASYSMGLSGALGPFNDGWKRTAFASTARLVNPAGRRE